MQRNEIAALLAYVDRLDPSRAPQTKAAARERLDQWAILLEHVPATAQHPDGADRSWDASRIAARHIATSPYLIKPSDIGAPWETFRADLMNRHVGTFEPTQHPEIDPDDETGNAYVRALRAERHAVATGQRTPDTHRAITAGPMAAQVKRRLAELGTYMPPSVAEALADYRPHRADRERLAAADLPDPLTVPCPYEPCRAPVGQQCRQGASRRRRTPHPSRLDVATARHYAQEPAA
ncbi:cell surface glycoprotein [Streptomyces nodosus]|uniref:zinc finger domain-containing protein n=1 Tax=Streptomyces nodosus TaxID=40318 RepID=UPI0036E334FF